ncbi:MAG: AAA family ATPase [Myxococcales bacterium]|nr:AAA family ATPase [Myxococcales bacterium]
MFSFKFIELMNWDLWDHVRVPLDEQVVMIAGPNGSGKTTFLDAMRILLGARTLSTSRKLGSYLRGDTSVAVVKGVVTNPLRRGFGKRPFTHRGIFEDDATLACIIERRSGTWLRRYAILPGDASLDEIRQSPNLLSPEEYSRDLEKANLPRTLLKILALEQGDTNKLCKRTPQQLLEYVLEMQGDKQVMENYAAAKESYVLSERELRDQEAKVYDIRRHLHILEQDARSYERYRDLEEEVAEIRAVRLPIARYRGFLEQVRTLDAEIAEAEAARALREEEAVRILGDSSVVVEEIGRLQEGVRVKKNDQQVILQKKEGVDGEYRAVRMLLKEIEDLQAKLGSETNAVEKSPEELETERRQLVVAEAGHNAEAERARNEMMELRSERRRLDSGQKREPPPWVVRMGERLAQERISAVLVADVIEVKDAKWQVAIESLLGRDRFTYLVDSQHSLAARQIAQQQQYPCYVSNFETPVKQKPEAGTALSQVSLADDRVPRWILSQLDRVRLVEDVAEGARLGKDSISITPDGYRQDPRGGVFIGVKETYCGGHAKSGRIAEISRRMDELQTTVAQRENDATQLRRRLSLIERALERQRERVRLLERQEALPGLRARSDELAEQKRALSQELMDAMTEVDGLNAAILEKEKNLGLSDYRRKLLEQERQKAQSDLQQRISKRSKLTLELKDAELAVPEHKRTETALALHESEGQLVERLKVLSDNIGGFVGCKDPAILGIFDKARADFDAQQQVLAQRQGEHRRGEQELRKARRSYIRVMEQTVARYRNNILHLAQRAGVEVEIFAPKLVDDDEVLAKAGIEIRIGFDGKRPVPINHPKLSGGQSVIASLILLMALTMQEEGEAGGFFILDEPFAHLSVERIDDITRFLSITNAQFILTTPTTHNLMVFNPARLTLNLRKKPAGAKFAPVPAYLRR